MSEPQIRLPAAAVEALSRGAVIEAIRIVHASGGGLKEAKMMVETFARQQVEPFMPESSAPTSAHVPGTATGTMTKKLVVPPAASEALRRGEVVMAVKLVRDANPGLGLADAKAVIDRLRQSVPVRGDGQTTIPKPAATPDAMHRSERVPTVVSGDGEQPVWLLFAAVLMIAGAAWWFFA